MKYDGRLLDYRWCNQECFKSRILTLFIIDRFIIDLSRWNEKKMKWSRIESWWCRMDDLEMNLTKILFLYIDDHKGSGATRYQLQHQQNGFIPMCLFVWVLLIQLCLLEAVQTSGRLDDNQFHRWAISVSRQKTLARVFSFVWCVTKCVYQTSNFDTRYLFFIINMYGDELQNECIIYCHTHFLHLI